MAGGSISSKAQEAMGLPPGFKAFSPFPFAGMNVQASPLAIQDNEFTWIENFLRLGDGNLRTAWDIGTELFSTNELVNYFFYTIGDAYYCIVFYTNGNAVQINMDTGARTDIVPSLKFWLASAPTNLPFAKTWGTDYLLISNKNTKNDYWAWDGSLLYFAGSAAPDGVNILSGGFNYTSNPLISASGGHGSGMSIGAVVSGGQITELNIANPGSGYEVGDIVQLIFTGGGSDSSAYIVANLTSGTVGGATITAPGAGYTTATATFTGGGGSGAAATVTLTAGAVTEITVTNPGSGYTSAPAITITGDGVGATAVAVLASSGVASATVVNGGSGFTSVPLISFVGGQGSGATGVAVLTPTSVAAVNLTSGGSGYTSAPTVAFVGGQTVSIPTTNAVVTANLTGATVTSYTVVTGGSGYTSTPTVTVAGGGGAGATAVATVVAGAVTAVTPVTVGAGYGAVPTVTLTGGGSAGAVATAVANLVGDQVGSVTITNAGGQYTSPVQVTFTGGGGSGAGGEVVFAPTSIASVVISSTGKYYTDAPTVEITPGANNSAYATVSLMPFGVSGSAFETYLSRLWIVDPAPSLTNNKPSGGNWSVSAPGSFIDFATSDGGVAATNTDSFLQTRYTNVRQSAGYLYFYGDGSVSVVSNVSTQGAPTVTTVYNYQNVDPQAGAEWRDTLQDFGRSAILANPTGVFGLYGGTMSKISQKLDQVFTPYAKGGLYVGPDQGGITPSSAIATIFNIKHYLLLLTLYDPDLKQKRNVMLTWNEKDWVVTSQSVNLLSIATQKVGSEYFAYGYAIVGGLAKIYPLFGSPSVALTKRLDTKQYGGDRMFLQKQSQAVWLQAQDHSSTGAGVSGTFTMVASGIGIQSAWNPSGQSLTSSAVFHIQPSFEAPEPYWPLWGTSTGGIYFVTMSLRFSTNAPDFTLGNMVIGYVDKVAYFGQ